MNNDQTVIKPIPGYESQYLIDNWGNVYSVQRNVPTGLPCGTRQAGGKILSSHVDRKGRNIVQLFKNGKKTNYDVQNLLRKAFG